MDRLRLTKTDPLKLVHYGLDLHYKPCGSKVFLDLPFNPTNVTCLPYEDTVVAVVEQSYLGPVNRNKTIGL
jgi:hypothetical protein